MKKSRKAQLEALEERAARLLRRRAPVVDTGPLPTTIIVARLSAMGPMPPVTPEEFDAGTAIMRSQVAEASGACCEVLARLLRLRIAHREDAILP